MESAFWETPCALIGENTIPITNDKHRYQLNYGSAFLSLAAPHRAAFTQQRIAVEVSCVKSRPRNICLQGSRWEYDDVFVKECLCKAIGDVLGIPPFPLSQREPPLLHSHKQRFRPARQDVR